MLTLCKRPWPAIGVAMLALLMSACASMSTETVAYEPVASGDFSPRSRPAIPTREPDKNLLGKDYFKLGHLSVTHVIEDDGAQISHNESPTARAVREAATRGADLLRVDKDNAHDSQLLFKTGACRRWETRSEYKCHEVCDHWGSGTSCQSKSQKCGFENNRVCAEFERIAYTRVQMVTVGSIWRHDPQRVGADRALRKALTTGPASDLEKLLKSRGSVEAPLLDGRRPLSVAAEAGNVQAVRLLLERGAKSDLGDLQLATEKGHGAVARLLVERGTASGDPAADQAALWSASVLGQTTVVAALMARGADPKTRDATDGQNALHKAAWACRLDTVKLLLTRGADRGATTRDGERAIDLARSSAEWSKRSPAEQAACREIVQLLGR